MNDASGTFETSETPVLIPNEAYVSQDYAKSEGERLWPKVWQIACREEELAKVGDFVVYDILDDSIIVTRSAPDQISAYFNVCQHRGRRLADGCGHARAFTCRFHGWSWNLDGKCQYILDPEDWNDALDDENTRLPPVRVGRWGGWVWINMDPEAESLEDYLGEAKTLLDPFEIDQLRFKWRQWLYFPCNWKTALEAFNESYHVQTSHPQLMRWVNYRHWSRAAGKHGHHGVLAPRDGAHEQGGSGLSGVNVRGEDDPRIAVAEQFEEMARTLDATTPQTILEAANRLVDELPEGTGPAEVGAHLMESAMRDDAARGVIWPEITHDQMHAAGFDWHLFPNFIVLPGPTFALCYRARPNGHDPDSCIFEVCALERYPKGEETETEWVFEPDPTEEKWRLILSQDFSNMPEVQRGMKSRGFKGARPNPREEAVIANFHRVLAQYMGTGEPMPLSRSE